MPPKINPVFDNFFPPSVIAFTSDRAVDFTLDPGQPSLNGIQKEYLAGVIGFEIPEPASLAQVHGDRIFMVDECNQNLGGDGLLTSRAMCPLAVRSADCLPIFIWDGSKECIGLIHAGWKGSRLNIAGKAIEHFISHCESNPGDIKIAFGPTICSHCYEVGKEFLKYFPDDAKERDGRHFLDLKSLNKRQLLESGVDSKSICDSEICTKCSDQYFSYRRDGDRAGRMISIMMINK